MQLISVRTQSSHLSELTDVSCWWHLAFPWTWKLLRPPCDLYLTAPRMLRVCRQFGVVVPLWCLWILSPVGFESSPSNGAIYLWSMLSSPNDLRLPAVGLGSFQISSPPPTYLACCGSGSYLLTVKQLIRNLLVLYHYTHNPTKLRYRRLAAMTAIGSEALPLWSCWCLNARDMNSPHSTLHFILH